MVVVISITCFLICDKILKNKTSQIVLTMQSGVLVELSVALCMTPHQTLIRQAFKLYSDQWCKSNQSNAWDSWR